MEFLVLFLVIVGLFLYQSKMGDSIERKPPCNVHKWGWKGEAPREYMECLECGLRPGISAGGDDGHED